MKQTEDRPSAGGTYGQGDASSSAQRSRSRTDKTGQAAGNTASNAGATLEGGKNLKGAGANGASDDDMGRGGD